MKPKIPKVVRYWPTVKACCQAVGIPEPEAEQTFYEGRKWRFDFSWGYGPCNKVALEVDGGVWSGGRHGRGSGIVKEHQKFNAAAARGWLVFRCTPQTVGDLVMWKQIKEVL